MAGANHANHEFVGENHPNPPNHHNQFDGQEASVTPEGSAAHAQVTPLDVPPPQPPQPEDPLVAGGDTSRASEQHAWTERADPRPRNRRSPPWRNNRSPPRSGEAAARGGNARHSPRGESPSSGDERHRGPLSRRIMGIPLPRGLEKPPTLDKYDGTTDPDEHVQSVETALDYRNLRGSIKCKLFPLSLTRGTSTWWRNLPPGSIDSWEELCRMFTTHFTTSRRHPKTVASLKAIVQGPEESLRNYIERFNKVSVEVEATDKMKLYLLEEGLREGTKFQEAVGILEVETLDAFFELAQRYIKYEDKQKASEVGGPSSQREERQGDEKKREGGKVREAKPPKSQFTYHTPLNAPRDRILSEISNAEFKSAGIRFPKQLPAKPNVDKKKFCRFHKSYGHVTDDCVHLKDAIEILIQKGYARQYVDGQPRAANNNAPRQNQLAVDPASPEQHVEDENRVIGAVALAISRPEDFLPLQTDEEKGTLDYLAAHLDGSWENFPGALVISGGGFNPITIGSIKRKFDELEKASPVEEIKITEVKESSVPLAFYREEVPGGSPNFQIPLLVRAKMANFDVRRILVDQGSSCDIIFVAKSAQHALPLFKLLRKETTFEWTEECEGALQHLKRALSEPPVLTRPVEGEKLYLYLAVASEAISAVLIRETEQGQKPVYFVSRALQGPELRYLQIEKIALAQLLARPDMVGRMLKWSLELAEFDISFESRKALKAQVLADFVAEMTTSTTSEKNKWTIFVDGSSNSQGSGAGIILENGDGVLIEVSLGLSFPTTNNQAEYEAFLAGLRLAEDMGAEEIRIFTDSQLVASQVSGEYQTKEERLLEYLNLIRAKLAKFKETEVKHVPREHNARADVLSKLASTRHKKAGNQSLIQETLTKPSIEKTAEVMHICAVDVQSWLSPVYNFLKSNTLPVDAKEATKIRKRACSYVLLDDKLYRRGFSIPLLKCVEETPVEFILQEIHEGINGQHIGVRSLARKALRAGYYWPTMQNDARDHVLKCDKCQRHGDMHLAPANELKTLISPWPFAWWGMDILGPFPTTARQVKYLIVAVDYFTKWIEAEPLAKISASNILRFFKRDVLARFGIPQVVVTDNGTQFTNKKFQEFLAAIGTTQHFTTTPHSTTGETPFRLTYGTEAVIPVEIGEPSSRIEYPLKEDINDELLREELDLVEELRTGASLREATLKQKIAARHDKRVIKREFEVGSLVLRRNQKDS
ncbi:hypothetical protein TSUD_342220 [Trifolium subterraneum]|nr:hypothetical protein TSUD_342220 [Trifolium subterraneum]